MALPLWPGGSVSTSRGVLHVRRSGRPGGVPVVLVHGLSGSAGNWTDLMGELGDEFECHAVDLPGHGRSAPPPDGRYTLDAHVAAVVAYIEEHVRRAPVHLFGNSLGGAVATRLASERPELVRTLSLMSPALPLYRRQRLGEPALALMVLPGINKLVAGQMSKASGEARAQRLINLCYARPENIDPQRRREIVAEMERRRVLPWAPASLEGSLRGLVRSYADPGRRNIWRQAARVRCPVLLVHGAEDKLVPVGVAARAGTVFPDVRVVVLDDVGHVPQIEQPATVAAEFLELLAERDRLAS